MRPQPKLRAKAGLVLALLAGLLGMHGLAPSPAAALPNTAAAHAPTGAGTHPGTHPRTDAIGSGGAHRTEHDAHRTEGDGAGHRTAPAAHGDRHERVCHDGGQGHSPHGRHTDQHCASATVPGSPPLTGALAPSVRSSALPVPPPLSPESYAPVGGRAPPTLAELQLLRI
ncbi:hypothetical protein DVA86_22945 [Streptomyces armeniacus]|uniref:Secreted protein n=1 Tax=Streptomyces armeniacus TaxID=83291 RepID=A0A345Y105_9ACTN|nr:hypothetical protein DVA86_22945 [Streptomyces armeniacus]